MPAGTPTLLRIGPFSRLARVTIKTLRFYDGAGLFQPLRVDPHSGYRFYSTTQLPALRRIRLLRELGCSVAEIRQMGQMDEPQAVALRRRLLVSAALAEQRLELLDGLLALEPGPRGLGGETAQSTGVTQPRPVLGAGLLRLAAKALAAAPALTIRDCVRSGGNDIHRMFEAAERQVARNGMRAQQSPFLLLHGMDYRRPHMDVEVCVPVRPEALGSAGVRLVEPVPQAACVRFSGDYDQAPVLLDAALDSLQGTQARLAGPIRELYLRFGADQRGYTLDPRFLADNVARYTTELQIPIRSPSGC